MNQTEVLIVEDEEDILHLIYFNLSRAGFLVRTATDGLSALREVKKGHPHLILLDLMLPGMSGLEVCRRLKEEKHTRHIPVIMLTAKGEESDIIAGLDSGADDYINKPFSPAVLVARMHAVLRRHQIEHSPDDSIIQQDDFVISIHTHEAAFMNTKLSLTPLEFKFLLLLIQKPGWVFTRNQIVDSIRGEEYAVTHRSVDVLVVGLRKKLRMVHPDGAGRVETVRGVGYRLKMLDD